MFVTVYIPTSSEELSHSCTSPSTLGSIQFYHLGKAGKSNRVLSLILVWNQVPYLILSLIVSFMFMGHVYLLFCKMPVYVFHPFFFWAFFPNWFVEVLYIYLNISPLSDYVLQICSPNLYCPLISLMVFSDE